MTTFLGDFSYGTETHWLTGLAMELYCPPGNSAWLFIPTLFSLRSLGITWELVRNGIKLSPISLLVYLESGDLARSHGDTSGQKIRLTQRNSDYGSGSEISPDTLDFTNNFYRKLL